MSIKRASLKERVIHAAGYELLAAGICAPVLSYIFDKPLASTGALALALSMVAMLWNMAYNALVDRWTTTERVKWGLGTRVLHGVGFEAGIVMICLPLGMLVLNISLLEAFMLELGFFAFILPYTIFYNWGFDNIKSFLFSQSESDRQGAS